MSSFTASLFVVCVLSIYLIGPAYLTSNLTPDDEDSDTYNEFLALLESKTGLANLTANYIIPFTCDGSVTDCRVNPNGDVIWDVRLALYEKHMQQNESDVQTLDGCLKNHKDVSQNQTYNDCMVQVRTNMINYLNNDFDTLFISKINCNNTLIETNCLL